MKKMIFSKPDLNMHFVRFEYLLKLEKKYINEDKNKKFQFKELELSDVLLSIPGINSYSEKLVLN